MFEYIIGEVVSVKPDKIVVESNNIGYSFTVSGNTAAKAVKGEKIKIYCRMIVREDEIYLCGFSSNDEVEMFDLLTTVSKIGPKVALGILSFSTPQNIAAYISTNEIEMLKKAPGVGKKTAERIVLELKDKLEKNLSFRFDNVFESDPDIVDNRTSMANFDEVTQALVTLGYSQAEAKSACEKIKDKDLSTEDMIKKALGILMIG